ncbi:MAG: ceramide glucosyltransferase [Thermoanaerobaculia bacterium]
MTGPARQAERSGQGREFGERVLSVSILKPLKGAEPDLESNLESFYRLDYPEFEIIFSFASRDEEAFPVARRVADRHPEIPTAFVFDAREPGRNPKVSRLIAAVSRAQHPILLISDADVVVPPDYLECSVLEFADPTVGLVSNPFHCDGRDSAGSTIESLHMNGFVLGGTAAVSCFLKRPCVVGKSIFLRRSALDWIGGLDAVRDHLAEDFLLGDLMVRAGFRAVLSRHFVTVISRRKTIRSFWDRQVRWARMRRKLAGPAYFAEVFASPVPWALPLLVLGGAPGAAAALAAAGLKIASDIALLKRGKSLPARASLPGWIATKDLLAFGVFWAGLASDRTRWRGQSVRIGKRTILTHSG